MREFQYASNPSEYRRQMRSSMCHRNSILTAAKHPNLGYAEGLALTANNELKRMWLPHAWNVNLTDNTVIDRTWIHDEFETIKPRYVGSILYLDEVIKWTEDRIGPIIPTDLATRINDNRRYWCMVNDKYLNDIANQVNAAKMSIEDVIRSDELASHR